MISKVSISRRLVVTLIVVVFLGIGIAIGLLLPYFNTNSPPSTSISRPTTAILTAQEEPLFFAIIGAQVDLRGVNLNVLYLSGIVVAIAVATKVVGCGLPSIIFLKDKTKAFRVGIGMVSRGEVGLIVAGVGVSTGALTSDTYTTVIIMVALTTIITPVWLKKSYSNESNLTAQPT